MSQARSIDVLLVEDDAGEALLITEGLRTVGIINGIRSVSDGQMALDYLYREGEFNDHKEAPRPDVILLDLHLPKVDGFTILSRIKRDKDLKRIPVIILTSQEDQRDIDRGYQLGANLYITKPGDYREFLAKIRHLHYCLEIMQYPGGGT